MSHVVVGERIAGAAPHIAGHIIVGAGHLAETVGGWFQTGAPNIVIPTMAQKSINDLSTPVAAEQWQWQKLNGNYGSGASFASGNDAYQECLKKIDFTIAGTEKPANFSKGINFSFEKDTTVAYGLDMHYNGPGSEAEQLREAYHDQQGREAADRVNRGTNDARDTERANEYYREHSA